MDYTRLGGVGIAFTGLSQLAVWVYRLEPFTPLGYVVGLGGFLLFSTGAHLALGRTVETVYGSRRGVVALLVYAFVSVGAMFLVFYPLDKLL
jgi:hypothetical protein